MKVAIVEDHAIVRDLLRIICERDFGYTTVCADSGHGAADLIVSRGASLVLLDLCLPKLDGFKVVEKVRYRGHAPRFLAVSARCDPYTIYRVEQAKLDGFLDKRSALAEELRAALESLAGGIPYFSQSYLDLRKQQRADPKAFFKLLTERQQEILSLVGDLHTDEEIASELGLSAETAKKHRFRIMRRLGLATKNELLKYVRKAGFTPLCQPDSEN